MSGEAEKFAAVLREESLRRVDDRYVHNAIIRTQMRTMADTIERWERLEFTGPGPYRVGSHYGIHVYEGDRPVATFHTVADARWFVQAANGCDAAALPHPSTDPDG